MTTATIMRSKQTSSTSIGRPIHTARSQYNGGVIHPQWMRSLEEKYQRIHMKIARSTTAMSNIYNSSLGRSNNIQEKTLLKASLARPTDNSPGKSVQYRRVASSLERGVDRSRILETDTVTGESPDNSRQIENVVLTPTKGENLELTEANVDKPCVELDDTVIELCDETDKTEDCDSENSLADDEDNIGYVIEGVDDVESAPPSDEDDDENEKDTHDVKKLEEEGLDFKESDLLIGQSSSALEDKNVNYNSRAVIQDTNKLSPVKGEHRNHFITQLGKRYQNKPERFIRREQIPRTSTSRRSIQTHKTSKSCPATIEHIHPQTDKETHVRSKSSKRSAKGQRNSNMFSRMSVEAQHARTEILKENKPFSSKKQTRHQQKQRNHTSKKPSESDGRSSSSKEEDNEQKPDVVQKNESKSSHDKLVDRLYSDEDYNKMFTNGNEITKCEHENAYSDSEISNANRKHAFTVLANRTKLPNIDDGRYVTLQHLKTLQYTLPGIGRYNVAPKRETTFEITPPGFDIRYKDMMVLEERESETPPPDIRNRAVQKCQEWLARYTPR